MMEFFFARLCMRPSASVVDVQHCNSNFYKRITDLDFDISFLHILHICFNIVTNARELLLY